MFKGKEKPCSFVGVCLRKMGANQERRGRKWKLVKENDNIEQRNKKDCTVYLCFYSGNSEVISLRSISRAPL